MNTAEPGGRQPSLLRTAGPGGAAGAAAGGPAGADRAATSVTAEAGGAGGKAGTAAVGLLALALAASPAYVIRFHFGGVPTTLLEIVLLVAIAAGLAVTRGRLPWRNPYLWPGALLLAAATLDVWFAPSHRAAAGIWKAYFIEPALAALLIAALADTGNRVRLVLAGLGVAGLIVALADLSVSLPDILGHTYNVVTPQVAIFNSSNDVALYLVPLDAVALAICLYDDERRDRIAAGIFFAVTALASVLSYSRGGWLALAVATVFVALFHPRRLWVAGGVAAAVLLAVLGSSQIRHRILVELEPGNPANTVQLRLPLWRTAFRMLEHHPVFGAGLSGFQVDAEPFRDPGFHEQLIYPHDIFLNFWSETGLLGLAGFLWLCLAMVRRSWAALGSAAPLGRAVLIGLLGALAAIFVHGLVDVPYFKNDLALAFWALVGLQLAVLRRPEIG